MKLLNFSRFKVLTLIALAISVVFPTPSQATTSGMGTVFQPIYVHTDTDSEIRVLEIPFVAWTVYPEGIFTAITYDFFPARSPLMKSEPQNGNLVAVYKIDVSGKVGDDDFSLEAVIDVTKSKRPKDYPFTLAEVVDATAICIQRSIRGSKVKGGDARKLKIILRNGDVDREYSLSIAEKLLEKESPEKSTDDKKPEKR